MADWSELVRMHQHDVLEEGEQVLSTLLVNPPGSIRNAAIGGGMAERSQSAEAAAGMGAANQRTATPAQDLHDLSTLAARFPVGFMLIAVTNRRLLVFDRGSARTKRPQNLVAVFPREAVARAASSSRLLRRDLEIEFVDGSVVALEAEVAQPFVEFEHLLSAG